MRAVPTAAELVSLGLAQVRQGSGTYYISPEGHALLGEILRANGQEARDGYEHHPRTAG